MSETISIAPSSNTTIISKPPAGNEVKPIIEQNIEPKPMVGSQNESPSSELGSIVDVAV